VSADDPSQIPVSRWTIDASTKHWIADLDAARQMMRQAFIDLTTVLAGYDNPELSVQQISTNFWDANRAMNTILANPPKGH
jgi:hypothetical protein